MADEVKAKPDVAGSAAATAVAADKAADSAAATASLASEAKDGKDSDADAKAIADAKMKLDAAHLTATKAAAVTDAHNDRITALETRLANLEAKLKHWF
jgi:polyhydroxyalkanoate synthesis regulator phasin